MKQETQSNTADPGGEFLNCLLSDMKIMNAKEKRVFKFGLVKLIYDVLENTKVTIIY
jgi:hypothetical protein